MASAPANVSRPTDGAKLKSFPVPPSVWTLFGPSFVILALGLGSGEVILWPYLVSKYGLGLAWGAVLGITFQYFINMEIERYALVRGESVFVGISQFLKWAPYWFIISTFIGFGLPGIALSSSSIFGYAFSLSNSAWLAVVILVLIGVILCSGQKVYVLVEKLTRALLLIGVPLILVMAVLTSDWAAWKQLAGGLIGLGEGYYFLPAGIELASFLAAFAYSGAGGNLNLTQSIYIREKGYGMGQYADKMSGLFTGGQNRQLRLEGHAFDHTQAGNIRNYKKWWKIISIEHLSVFWGAGLLSMLLLMLLAYNTAYGQAGIPAGVGFIFTQGLSLKQNFGDVFGLVFLLATGIMLFQTQLAVLDSTSRIMGENWLLTRPNRKTSPLSRFYFGFLWSQIIFGSVLILAGVSSPQPVLVLAAVLNALAMFVHIGLVNYTNFKLLPKVTRPAKWRMAILLLIFILFGIFSFYTISHEIIKLGLK
jgi:hypothetical protein